MASRSEIDSVTPGRHAIWLRLGLILFFGSALTVIAFRIARTLEDQRLEREFEIGASDRVTAVQRALDSQHLLLEATSLIPAENEEDVYRLRSVRLAEKGFLPFDEAISVYRPLGAEELLQQKSKYIADDPGPAVV